MSLSKRKDLAETYETFSDEVFSYKRWHDDSSEHSASIKRRKIDQKPHAPEQEHDKETSNPYVYQPLPPGRYFRLLRIHRGSGKDTDSPQLDLVPFPLDECPPYQTMSYVWGDLDRTEHSLKVGSQELGITTTLSVALPRIFKHCSDGFLWCDQLCINQDDLRERNCQVAMMADIYRNASIVLVWLDLEDWVADELLHWLDVLDLQHKGYYWSEMQPGTGLALDEEQPYVDKNFMDAILSEMHQYGSSPASGSSKEKCPSIDSKSERSEPNYSGTDRDGTDSDNNDPVFTVPTEWLVLRDALESVFNSAWLTRVWIVQEVLLSSGVAVLLGDQLCSLQGICRLHFAVGRATFSGKRVSWEPLTDTRGYSMLAFLEEWHILPSFGRTLYGLLFEVNCYEEQMEASDPKDLIYGLLALANNPEPYAVEPDYSLPQTLVYIQVARSIIESRRDLAILLACHGVDRDQWWLDSESKSLNGSPLPTWVPDWRFGASFRDIDDLNVSVAQSWSPGPMTDIRRLFTRGKAIDSIDYISERALFEAIRSSYYSVLIMDETFAPMRKDFEDFEYCVSRFRHLHGLLNDIPVGPRLDDYMVLKAWFSWHCTRWYKPPGGNRIENLATMILAGFDLLAARYRSPGLPERSDVHDEDEDLFPFYNRRPEAKMIVCEHNRGVDKECPVQDCNMATSRVLLESTETFNGIPLQAVGVTSRGKITLARGNARSGDVVAVLRGFPMPILLRKTEEGCYQYVSECYHEDAMDANGDLIQWPEEEDKPIILV